MARVQKIGLLLGWGPVPASFSIEAFRQGLRELGYLEGQNIAMEYRVQEHSGRLSDLAAELVRLKLDIIVANSTGPVTLRRLVRSSNIGSSGVSGRLISAVAFAILIFSGLADPSAGPASTSNSVSAAGPGCTRRLTRARTRTKTGRPGAPRSSSPSPSTRAPVRHADPVRSGQREVAAWGS